MYSEIDGLGRVVMLFDAPDRLRVLELDVTVRPSSAPDGKVAALIGQSNGDPQATRAVRVP